MKHIMLLCPVFFTIGITFSILHADTDVQARIEKIRKEFYDLNKKSMKRVAFFMEQGKEGWQRGVGEGAQVEAIVYLDGNRIRKFFTGADSGNVYSKQEEYFWEEGGVFFVFHVQEWQEADEYHRIEVRLYFWNNSIIRNLASETVRKDGSSRVKNINYSPSSISYHRNAGEIVREFKLHPGR
jgi:hypothetical protein